MRIDRLALERYGRFTDQELVFRPDAPVHIVLGANEAGKTTILNAIADLLFGFGARTDYDFQHDGKFLRIGANLRLADGRELKLRRRKGNKNTLIDENEQPLPDELLDPVTGSLTHDSFCREFGLTAEALRKGGDELLRAGGRLAETLAAGSAGLSALTALRASLDEEADGLFTSRKSSSKPFYVAADRYSEADRKLRDSIITADQLQEAENRIVAAQSHKDELIRAHDQSGRDLRRLERTSRTRKALDRLDRLELELEALSGLPQIPTQLVSDWRAALQLDAEILANIRQLDEADAKDLATIAALGVDEALLAAGSIIDALRERLGAVSKAMDDLPRRQEARRQAQAELDELARRLGLVGHESLLARRPTDMAIARVRELAEALTVARGRRADAEGRVQSARKALNELQSDSDAAAAARDPEPFGQRLSTFSHIPEYASRVKRETAAYDTEFQALNRRVSSLNPPVNSLQLLTSLHLPAEAEIASFAQTFADLDGRQRKIEGEIETAERSIRDREVEIARFTADGVNTTRADLVVARGQRDSAFGTLHTMLDGDPSARRLAFDDLHGKSRATDDVTDRLLGDSDRATRLETAVTQRAETEQIRTRAVSQLRAVRELYAANEGRWQDLWKALGLPPQSPSEMTKWRQQVRDILERYESLEVKRGELASLSEHLWQARGLLGRFMEEHGRTTDVEASAEFLYQEATTWHGELQKAWTAVREIAVARKAAAVKLVEAQDDMDKADNQIEVVREQWPEALVAIGLAPEASVVEVASAIDVWQGVGVPKLSLERETRSVEGIERDIDDFEKDVASLAATITTGLADTDARSQLQSIIGVLDHTRVVAGEREGLRKAITERQSMRAGLETKRAALRVTLDGARQRLQTADEEALLTTIDHLEKRHYLQAEHLSELERLQDSADGLDHAALRTERALIDHDLLPGELERLKIQVSSLLTKIGETSVAIDRAQTEYEDLSKGRDAIGAARDREEAATDLLSIARRWLVRASAARLAASAIERHRAKAQDPLLARAGQFLHKVTGGAFSTLAVDYGRDDLPELVAVRARGTRVPIVGLSEGTRDQLYLSLRLSLLELRTSESMPFIADDLLTSFDDRRTEHVLELLAEFGRRSQVIVFTHHEHVARLATSAISSVDLTLLQ